MSTKQGIQNYSELSDKDKAYIVRLTVTIIGGIITGIVMGLIYDGNGVITYIGLPIFAAITLGMALLTKQMFDLSEMSDQQILRHGIALGFMSFFFFTTVIFNFMQFL